MGKFLRKSNVELFEQTLQNPQKMNELIDFKQQQQNCSICLDVCQEESVLIDKCYHEFCYKCIFEWIKLSNKCPLCKVEFNNVEHLKNGKLQKIIKVSKKDLEIQEEIDSEIERILNAEDFCYECKRSDNDNVLLVCDKCIQKCCHTYCDQPPLEFIPEGEWYCKFCEPKQQQKKTIKKEKKNRKIRKERVKNKIQIDNKDTQKKSADENEKIRSKYIDNNSDSDFEIFQNLDKRIQRKKYGLQLKNFFDIMYKSNQ